MTKLPSPLVSTDWLAANLAAPDLVVLDASHHLPAAARDAAAEFAAAHIPGARFLGLASLFDAASPVPYAFPTPAQLAERLASLGVAADAAIVIYDDSAIRTSARAWFVLTASGIETVAILDGGLGKWRAEGRAYGSGVDPVHVVPNGRIPGALNLPFNQVMNADGTYKSPEELRAAFTAAGVDLDAPVAATCGSGVTASVLLFAMHLLGKQDAALYDGSWSEWGSDPATPKAEGPAA